MSTPEPPPFRSDPRRVKPPVQFSTATLLGVLTLVAVLCALAVTVPIVFAISLGILLNAVFVGYAAIVVVGAWLGKGRRQLFCIVALSSLALAVYGAYGTRFLLNNAWIAGWSQASWGAGVLSFVWTAEHIALSLFGGWVALCAARFWQPDEPQPSTASPPPSTTDVGD